jgi:hypothetical protein
MWILMGNNNRTVSLVPPLIVLDVVGHILRLARDGKPFDCPSWAAVSCGSGYVRVVTRNTSKEYSSIEWPTLRRMIERGYLVVE